MGVDILFEALRYAERGWHVFPIVEGEKRPLTQGGLKDATTDWKLVCNWWARFPNANVAICTGGISGIVVLDTDGEEGAESLRALEKAHGTLPPTASVCTPSGGQHYYFKHPGGDVRNSAGRLGAGVDVRADGGYVLAPPSQIGNRLYVPDARVPMAALPAWLLEASQPKMDGAAQATSEWLELVNGVPEGGRNHAMARFAGHLLRRYVDLELTRALAHLLNRSKFKPPLDGREVDRTVDSVFASELRRREAAKNAA